MLGLRKRRGIETSLKVTQWAIGTAVVVFGAALKAHPEDLPLVRPLIEWMQRWAWLVVFLGPILVGVAGWARRVYGNPWAWEAIQKIIDEFRSELFSGEATSNDPLDHHRVTLFRCCRFAWAKEGEWDLTTQDWCPRLVAVARSGHLTKDRIRRFKAPDDGEACEGVVGQAWRRQDWLVVPKSGDKLPELSSAYASKEIEAYAKETGVSQDWISSQLRKGRPLALSYAAIAVKHKGKPWGVLVIDSRKHGTIDPIKLERFAAFGSLLTPMLERT